MSMCTLCSLQSSSATIPLFLEARQACLCGVSEIPSIKKNRQYLILKVLKHWGINSTVNYVKGKRMKFFNFQMK